MKKTNRPKTNRQRTPDAPPAAPQGTGAAASAAAPRFRLPSLNLNLSPEAWLKARRVGGLLLLLLGFFLVISTISHLFTGTADQSALAGSLSPDEAPAPVRNWAGSLGAYFGQLLITKGFGYVALTLPFFILLLGWAVFKNAFWKDVRAVFPLLFFALYWCAMAGDLVDRIFDITTRDLGGDIGNSLNDWLGHYIGRIGVGALLLFTAVGFAIVRFNDQMKFVSGLPGGEKVMAFAQKIGGWFAPREAEPLDPASRPIRTGKGTPTASGNTEPNPADQPDPNKPDEENNEDEVIISVRKVRPPSGEFEVVGLEAEMADMPLPAVRTGPAPVVPAAEEDLENGVLIDPALLPRTPKFRPDGVEFVIEETRPEPPAEPDPMLDISVRPARPGIGGDDVTAFTTNIGRVGDDHYEKIIGEEDEPTLDDDEVVADWEEYDPLRDLSLYQYPTIELLRQYDAGQEKSVNREELEANKNRIVKTLQDYRIDIVSIKATIGPTVTLYEIVPAPGVRISKIKNLEDDIALSLAALGIRIIAPMPGKGTIGIEIPNSKPEVVSFRSMIATEKFRNTEAELPLAIGKTISNEVFIADLTKMPHVLVAGSTGQGKSVGLNAIIASILYKKHPSQVKFVLIDPKKVEMTLYQALEKHFLAKLPGFEDAIITDNAQVLAVLNSLCVEMDDRYELLKNARVRNILEYNAKFKQRRLNPKKGHRFLPYIVLVIDELADLMMTAGKEVETPICRLAQLARAVGIHLVVATQRPSVNVITGIIKANFPARMSYRVIGKVDSRTILDANGAEQLIGRGDMLLGTGSELIRLQTPFIDTPEVEDVVNFIASQQGYSEPYYLPEVPMEVMGKGKDKDDDDDFDDADGPRDKMFDEAARLVVRHQQGSTSLIQRRMKLGYNRSGRIMDQLERAGIVGPNNGSKPREVLVMTEAELEKYLV